MSPAAESCINGVGMCLKEMPLKSVTAKYPPQTRAGELSVFLLLLYIFHVYLNEDILPLPYTAVKLLVKWSAIDRNTHSMNNEFQINYFAHLCS